MPTFRDLCLDDLIDFCANSVKNGKIMPLSTLILLQWDNLANTMSRKPLELGS